MNLRLWGLLLLSAFCLPGCEHPGGSIQNVGVVINIPSGATPPVAPEQSADPDNPGAPAAPVPGVATYGEFFIHSNEKDYSGDPEKAILDEVVLREDTTFDSISTKLKNQALIDALYKRVKTMVHFSYAEARWKMYREIDLHRGFYEDVYLDRQIDPGALDDGRSGDPSVNCEHSWPKAQFSDPKPRESHYGYTDLHHLFPVKSNLNSSRGNLDYGMVVGKEHSLESLSGQDSRGQKVFQPRPEFRGDLARAHFYMAVRYSQGDYEIDDNDAPKDVKSLRYALIGVLGHGDGKIDDAEEAVLRRWHRDDPVSLREVIRNQRIEETPGNQGNRNPFVDYPGLVDYIGDF